MIVAAKRWNGSGANVRITVVRYERDADVIVRPDDRRLREQCGRLCFGFTRRWDGRRGRTRSCCARASTT